MPPRSPKDETKLWVGKAALAHGVCPRVFLPAAPPLGISQGSWGHTFPELILRDPRDP